MAIWPYFCYLKKRSISGRVTLRSTRTETSMPRQQAERVIVLDLDDFLTIASRGLPRAIKAIADGISRLVQVPVSEAEEELEKAIKRQNGLVQKHPTRGVKLGGHVVAHARGGALLGLFPPIRHVLNSVFEYEDDPDKQEGFIRLLIRGAYPHSRLVWRRGAADLIQALYLVRDVSPACVMTESPGDSARSKLIRLSDAQPPPEWVAWIVKNAIGDAGKIHIDPEWDTLPEKLRIPGMHRGVELRRPRYYTNLDEHRMRYRVSWNQLWVFGDNFEAELAVALAAGANVVLIIKKGTPKHEIEFVRQHERGHVISSLKEALQLLQLPS